MSIPDFGTAAWQDWKARQLQTQHGMKPDAAAQAAADMAKFLWIGKGRVADTFAARRINARKQQQPRREVAAVNRYQAALTTTYGDWADDLALQLAEAEPEDHDELIAAALLALLLLLQRQGGEHLPDAVALALERAGGTGTAAIWARLAAAIERNDTYLRDSLMPALGERLREMLASGEWALMRLEPVTALTDWVMGWLTTFASRIAMYAGTWWTLNQEVFGEASNGKPLIAYLDPDSRHCSECPLYHSEAGEHYSSYENYLGATGNRTPGQFECLSSCRCWLEFDDGAVATAGDLPA